jgi:hypothetical protein
MPKVYKNKGEKNYKTDIWIDGDKFSRSTGCEKERDAKIEAVRIETALREQHKKGAAAEVSLALDHVAGR